MAGGWPLGGMGFGGDPATDMMNRNNQNLQGAMGAYATHSTREKEKEADAAARRAQQDATLRQQGFSHALTDIRDKMKTPGLPPAAQHKLYESAREILGQLGANAPEITLEEWNPSYVKLFDQGVAVLGLGVSHEEKDEILDRMMADVAMRDPAAAVMLKRNKDRNQADRQGKVDQVANTYGRILNNEAEPEEAAQFLAQRAIAFRPDSASASPGERKVTVESAKIITEGMKKAHAERAAQIEAQNKGAMKLGETERLIERDPVTGAMRETVKGATQGPALSQPLKDALSGYGVDVRQLDPTKANDAALIARARRDIADTERADAVKKAEAMIGVEVRKKKALEGVKSQEVSETTITGLRTGFVKASEDFVKVRDAYSRVQASAKEPSAAGDLSLIFNYMKILDPGSVVRESEFAVAAQTGGYGERIQGHVQRALNGQRLADTVRKDFVDRADKLFDAQLGSHTKLEDEYGRIAKERGVTPSNIIVDYAGDMRTKGKKKDAPAAGGWTIKQVK